MKDVRTWIEIDQKALRHNVKQFLKLIPAHTRLMAVVKSNAYGHGLVQVASVLERMFRRTPVRLWFGVDSVVEALRLRKEGVGGRIFVLGYTLPFRIKDAAREHITLTVSNFDFLKAIAKAKKRPRFHIKIDTGMHRQGFMPSDVPRLISFLKRHDMAPEGIFTHLAQAKDSRRPAYTRTQMKHFRKAIGLFEHAGLHNVITHAAASGGILLFPDTRCDMVRIGMGLYGYWPSEESKRERKRLCISLRPGMSWKTIVAEVKKIPRGARVGYDGTERVKRRTTIAVLPIGYWHGYNRRLSGRGEVLIRGKRARVLGRVSMDMMVVDVTKIRGTRVGDMAVLLGNQGKASIWAEELAEKSGTSHYEFLTRINPLIRKIIV